MSLAVDVDKVTAVLLSDGWHTVGKNEDGTSTFHLDSYEYLWWAPGALLGDGDLLHGGGQSGICATGFTFRDQDFLEEPDNGTWTTGPLTAIQAVKTR